jgi:hypothetical protein
MTRNWVRRGTAVAVAGVLLVTAGSQYGYPQPPAPSTPLPPPAIDPLPSQPLIAAPVPDKGPATVDELIVTLENLRKQKEAIEKQEKVVAEQLKERLREQQERINKLGLNSPRSEPKTAEVPKREAVELPGLPDLPPRPVGKK